MTKGGRKSFVWRGEDVKRKMKRAVGRATVGWSEQLISGTKRAVHRMSGTLSRSLHAAGRGYNGAGDERAAAVGQLSSGGLGSVRDLPSWSGEVAFIEAGSWISYAIYEFARGGGHDFLNAAARDAGKKYPQLLRKAISQERLN